MDDKVFDELVRTIKDQAAKDLQKHGELRPVAATIGKSGGRYIDLRGGPGDEKRVLELCSEEEAEAVIQVSEAWLKRQKATDPLPVVGNLKDDPERKEALIVFWEHKQRAGLWMAPILRGDEGVTLGPWVEQVDIQGKRTRMLPRARGN